jgi:hypothetical protein
MVIRYFIRRAIGDHRILELSRIFDEPNALRAETWIGGTWTPNQRALRHLEGQDDADEVPQKDVDAVVRAVAIQVAWTGAKRP